MQSLDYAAQLREKQNQVHQALRRIGRLQGLEAVTRPIVGCSETFAYRNKVRPSAHACLQHAAA